MPTRRLFLTSAAAIVAVDLLSPDSASASSSAPSPAPTATPTPPAGPSKAARCVAKHLQASLKEANLDDALTEKIAGDIDGYLGFGKTFRAQKLRNSDEPDFIFSALEGSRR